MSKSGKPDSETREDVSVNPSASTEKKSSGLLNKFKAHNEARQGQEFTLEGWMDLCKTDPAAYQNYTDRLIKAIGEPEIINTHDSDQQTRLVYGGKKIARYKPFAELYDAEKSVSNLVTRIKNGARIVVLRGPVGSGKTEMATMVEKLAETQPIFVLKCNVTGQLSPFNDHPASLFSGDDMAAEASKELGIPRRYLNHVKSSWVTKRLNHHNGDPSAAFSVAKVYPSRELQLGIAKLDPQDPNSADMDALVGSVDMNKVGDTDPLDKRKTLSAGDPDAYKPGIFSRSHGGVFHAAEFFRNNPALFNTFLEGVTTGYFTGREGVGMLPMDQLVVITSNDPVWQKFMSANDSDAAVNRIELVDVPYTLRASEEKKIYSKLLDKNGFTDKPIAPGTLDLLAKFSVVTRLKDGIGGALKPFDEFIRARVMNGEIPDGPANKVPKLHELREKAELSEGLSGFSIRDAERVLKSTFNARSNEGVEEADQILLLETLSKFVKHAEEKTIPATDKPRYLGYIAKLAEEHKKDLEKKINAAIIDADDGTCQRIFDEYLEFAEAWLEDNNMYTRDGEPINRDKIEKYLLDFEKRAGVNSGNAEFRKSAVAAVNSEFKRIAKSNAAKPADEQQPLLVRWTTYEPVAKAIRAQYEVNQETRRQILRAKSVSDLRTQEEQRQYTRFHENMAKEGLTKTMVARGLHHLDFV